MRLFNKLLNRTCAFELHELQDISKENISLVYFIEINFLCE